MSVHVFSLVDPGILTSRRFSVDKDASNTFVDNVTIVNKPDWLYLVGCYHFKVSITTFEVIEAVRTLQCKGFSAEVFSKDFDENFSNLSIHEHSIRWLATETKGVVFANQFLSNWSCFVK